MKQTVARGMFPNHTLKFSLVKHQQFGEKRVSLYVRNSNDHVATIEQREDKVVVLVTRPARRKNGVAAFVAFAEIGSYKNVYDVEQAMNVDRKLDGLGAVGWEEARKQFKKSQEYDFDYAIGMLAVYFGVIDNCNSGYSREQFLFLTKQGKTLYRKAYLHMEAMREGAQEATQAFGGPVRELDMSPTDLAKASKLLQTSPVAQVAQTIANGKTKRANSDKRTVWSDEDEAIFALVEADHKYLSDRLAALHAARGSKISIPEWDRRKKAEKESC